MISRARLRSVARRECNSSPSRNSHDAPTSLSQLVYNTSEHELTTPLKREVLGTRRPRFALTSLVVVAARYRNIDTGNWRDIMNEWFSDDERRERRREKEVYQNFKCFLSTVIKYALRYINKLNNCKLINYQPCISMNLGYF